VVDVVLEGVAIDEKFLGLTLFTLIPNTTEFMNAMSFAMNGNIALRYVPLIDISDIQYGDWFGIRFASLPIANSIHGWL